MAGGVIMSACIPKLLYVWVSVHMVEVSYNIYDLRHQDSNTIVLKII